ncbi:MAG: TIGR02099 family protein, partial [Burkholderiales bacterium]
MSSPLRKLGGASARAVGWSLRRGLQLVVLTYFIAAAVVLVVKYGVLPRVPEYRDDIARAIAASIGEPVSIGGIDTGWTGLHPTLSIQDFKIHGRDGTVVLALPSVWGQVSWRSLLIWDLRFRSIIVSRPELDVRRAPEGKLFIGGIELKDEPGRAPGLGDWVLRQGEIVIDEGAIRWRDEVRAAPPLALRSVSLRLVNRFGNHHRIALRAVPPVGVAS